MRDRLQELEWKLSGPYPFDHAEGEISLARFALPHGVPAPDAVNDPMNAAGHVVQKLAALQGRLHGRLALAAEEVERALGLPPLEVPRPAEAIGA